MYKSEAEFSRAFVRLLTKEPAIMHQRIESGETGRGIPDLYTALKSREVWIELKNHNRLSIHDKSWRIKWRKGQQAWALKYKRARGLCSYTIVAMSDGFIIIPMVKHYVENVVPREKVICATHCRDLITFLKNFN